MNLMKSLNILLVCGAIGLSACSSEVEKFNNTDLTGLDYAQGFTLTDQNGKQRSLQDFKGKVVVVFFGYTQCPDVCPTTMAEMAAVMENLGNDANNVQVIFVSVDPQRDTPELLAAYVPKFDSRFIGMTGTQAQIDKVTKDFKVFYQKVPNKSGDNYTIDHTAGSYVFDKDGKIRLFLKHGVGSEVVAHDLKILLKQ